MTKKQAKQMEDMYWSLFPVKERPQVRRIMARVAGALAKEPKATILQRAGAMQILIARMVGESSPPARKKKASKKKATHQDRHGIA